MKNTIFLIGGVSPWSYRNSLDYLNEQLAECDGGDITVYIRSSGGSVFEGVDMHNALRAYANSNNAKVTTVAMGMVASIALFIFMAGDERHAFDNSTLMGHNSSNVTWGDRHEHKTSMHILESIDNIQAKKFQKLQGLELEVIKQNMTNEMWYIGEEQLLASKLVTKVLSTEEHLDIELPEGLSTELVRDPMKAHKEFVKAFAKESLDHEKAIDFDQVEQSVQACYGNCSIDTPQGNSECPTKDSVNLNNDKGELSMTPEELEKLQADYASSQSKVTELMAENDRLTKEAVALKEASEQAVTALTSKYESELKAHKKVFTTVLASGKHFNLDAATLQDNVDKATKELTANDNYTDGFVAHTVNSLVLANVETNGSFVAGGGNDPQANNDDGTDFWAKRNEKKGAN